MEWKHLLLCSKNSDFLNFVQNLTGDLNYSLRLIRSPEEIASLEPSYKPSALIMDCDPNTEPMLAGIVEGLRAKISGLKVSFLYGEGSNLELIDKLQNGPDFISFHLPLEGDLLLDWLFIVAPVDIPANKIKWDYLTSVRIPDLTPNEKIDFDLYHYMPANKKFILYTKKDGQLTPEQVERFRKNEVRDFYVRKNQLEALQKFLARRLSEVRKNQSLTETEKRDRLRKEAKEIFRSLLGAKSGSPKESRMVLESCKSVAMTFIQDTSDHPEFYQKLMQITAQGSNNYSHSVNVSIYATLFAMVLGEKNLEAASVAGLLHDVGLSTLRRKVDEIDESALSEADLVQLRSHPDSAVRLLKEKSTLDDESIFNAIAQHHEKFDGTGYPRGLKGAQICFLGRVCGIAEKFDHLTSVRPNHVAERPDQAVDTMMATGHYDNELLKELKTMFLPPKNTLMTDEQIRQLMRTPEFASYAAGSEDKVG